MLFLGLLSVSAQRPTICSGSSVSQFDRGLRLCASGHQWHRTTYTLLRMFSQLGYRMFIGGVSGGATADNRWICDVCGRGSCIRPLEDNEDLELACVAAIIESFRPMQYLMRGIFDLSLMVQREGASINFLLASKSTRRAVHVSINYVI